MAKAQKNSALELKEQQPTETLAEIIDRQIGDSVSQKQREVIVAKMTSLMISENFSGPIPHPRHLKGYEDISPGAAERIIAMAEKQQNHHVSMDERVLESEKDDRKLGMILGASTFGLLILCALISALLTESEIIPGLFLTTAAVGGVGLFVRGRQ